MTLASLSANEILDSRGRPTLQVRATLPDGREVTAGVPSGASTGSREAVELRDHGERYGGMGVTGAVDHVNGEIAGALTGRSWSSLHELDRALCELDGTEYKSRLGANAIVGVSMAAARAFAALADKPLWQWLTPRDVAPRLPVPHFNVINGGAHAANPLDFQEFMVAPLGAPSLPEAIRAGAEIYGQLTRILIEHDLATGLGDEGGFAPYIDTPERALTLLCQAIDRSGYRTGTDGVAIALDPAASEMFDGEHYRVGSDLLSSRDMVDRYASIVAKFPVWSIEDGVAETDTAGWQALTAALGDRIQLVGDDNFVTDAALIAAGADSGVANAALIKVNQVGTVTETLAALSVCRERGYAAMVSHRSGETTDTFIADLAVGCGCGQIKAGAPARGERVAKYNRLMQIAHTAQHLPFGVPDLL